MLSGSGSGNIEKGGRCLEKTSYIHANTQICFLTWRGLGEGDRTSVETCLQVHSVYLQQQLNMVQRTSSDFSRIMFYWMLNKIKIRAALKEVPESRSIDLHCNFFTGKIKSNLHTVQRRLHQHYLNTQVIIFPPNINLPLVFIQKFSTTRLLTKQSKFFVFGSGEHQKLKVTSWVFSEVKSKTTSRLSWLNLITHLFISVSAIFYPR